MKTKPVWILEDENGWVSVSDSYEALLEAADERPTLNGLTVYLLDNGKKELIEEL